MKYLYNLKTFFSLALVWASCFTSIVNVYGQTPCSWGIGLAHDNVNGSVSIIPLDVAVGTSGNVYSAGYFNGTVDFDHGPAVSNMTSLGTSIFIIKHDPSGNFLWAKIAPSNVGGNSIYSLNLALDQNENIYLSSDFEGTIDLDPGSGTSNHTSQGGRDFFVLKLNSGGNFQWGKTIGGQFLDITRAMEIDAAGNIYLGGSFTSSNTDFDPGVGIYTLTGPSSFICKLNSSGVFDWAKSIPNTYIESLALDASSSIHIAGDFTNSNVDFDPGAGTFTMSGPGRFVSKLTSTGVFTWAKSFQYSQAQSSDLKDSDVKVDGTGNVYVVGKLEGTVDFNPGVGVFNLTSVNPFSTSTALYDLYIAKLNVSGDFIWAKQVGGASAYVNNPSVAVDNTGNLYCTGSFSSTIDFDPSSSGTANLTATNTNGFANSTYTNGFVLKLNSTGNFGFVRSIKSNTVTPESIQVDASGVIYIAGRSGNGVPIDLDIDETVDLFSPNGNTSGNYFLIKYEHIPGLTINTTNITCFGGNNGSATIGISGPSSNYTFLWSNGQTTQSATGFSAGNHWVTISTAQECKRIKFSLTQPSTLLSLSSFVWNVSCFGGSNGTATVSAMGGNQPYTYSWNTSPIQTTPTATGLSVGTYTATVTDANGCIKTVNENIVEPQEINIAITKTNVTCFGGSNGNANAMVTGGTAPLSYSWSNNQTTQSATFLIAGTHTLTVTDANNCTKTASITITQPPAIEISISKTDANCFGAATGSATASIVGGVQPYSYSWNTIPLQTSQTATGLSAGNYTVTVTDANGCIKSAVVSIAQPLTISINISKTDVSCYGGSNGSATALVTGGVAPYSLIWNLNPSLNTVTLNNLIANVYSLTVTDANGCSSTSSISIDQPSTITAITDFSPNTKCSGICDGTGTVNASGGSPPYSYLWSDNQVTPTAVSLCHGEKSVIVTDNNGCTVLVNVNIETLSTFDSNVYLTNLAALGLTNVPPSFATYYSYNLPPTISPNLSNPRNFVDPGKRARFKVEGKNNKANGQSIVSGICKVRTNSPYITITDSSSALNNVGWGNNAWSADEFEININSTTPAGQNAYIDFIIQENGLDYATTCIAIPITPLNYSANTSATIDDDSNPDSQGNDNDIVEPNEIIEFYPLLNNVSILNAEYVRGRFENQDNHNFINIWNNTPGIGTTVFDATWWNFAFGQPQMINAGATLTSPEFDFVFNYNNTAVINNFKLYLVMAGGFKLFPGNALSLVQWTLPYNFNSTVNGIEDEQSASKQLVIYPNPTNGNAKISLEDEIIQSVEIFDQLGHPVKMVGSDKTELDLSRLSKGLYLIKVTTGSELFLRKIILQ